MIDPKLNEIPVSGAQGGSGARVAEVSEEGQEERVRRSRAGLSIGDTIAGDVNLSVGSRGVDTSGVGSGAGAGAGMTHSSPGRGDGSPAPNIVPGARGSGTTVRSDSNAGQVPTLNLDSQTSDGGTTAVSDLHSDALDSDAVAARAFECWHERGCPDGSPEVDWDRAQEELRTARTRKSSTANV
jgi:hypothetical protein